MPPTPLQTQDVSPERSDAHPATPPSNVLAFISLCYGVVALAACWLPIFNLIFAGPALIFGVSGVSKANRTGGSGRRIAKAGMDLGAISGAVTVLEFTVLII